MEISKEDKKRIKALASEGKTISDIFGQFKNTYPDTEYVDIYWIVYGAGGQSALGVKRTITNRINELVALKGDKKRFNEVIGELQELVNHLYKKTETSWRKFGKHSGSNLLCFMERRRDRAFTCPKSRRRGHGQFRYAMAQRKCTFDRCSQKADTGVILGPAAGVGRSRPLATSCRIVRDLT